MMSIINKIKTELILFLIVAFGVFTSINPDIILYNFFLNYDYFFKNYYLKDFFVKITELGNSAWYFGISFCSIVFFYLNRFFKILDTEKTKGFINFFSTSFIYLLVVGLVTQVLKHLIGRPRPNHTNFEESFEFYFFSFDSNYHSFPSGHSSTIFIVCLILCGALPKLKYFFYFLASIVAISRVVVGAHFFSDIVAGALLAMMLFKILSIYIDKNYSNNMVSEYVFQKNALLNHFLISLLLIVLFLTIGPSLDLYVSSLFYYGNSQFLLQSYNIFSKIFREGLLPLLIVYTLFFPIVGKFIKTEVLFFGYKFSTKEIFLVWFSQIFTILIFINLILKNLWGRSRPGDVEEFGGENSFTPWYEFSNSCSTNCSFVSGDASVGFSIIILYLITKKIMFVYIAIFSGLALGIIRIIAGGHFLSDILFAGVLVIILNLIIFNFYKKYYDQ